MPAKLFDDEPAQNLGMRELPSRSLGLEGAEQKDRV
jgi:hypothetical protein